VELIQATRNANGILHGASPRASIALMKIAQVLALFDDQEFVTPDHIQEIAVSVIAHRIVLDSEAQFSGTTAENIVEDIISNLPVPV